MATDNLSQDDPDLDDVLPTAEQAVPDHRAHAKTPAHLNDGALEDRTEHERQAVHSDDAGSPS